MSNTPRLALPYILTQQAQKEVTHAAGLNRLDALVQPVVQQIGLNTLPGSPAEGACWIIGPSPTAGWAGQANRLAQWDWNGSAWMLVAPRLLEASVTYDPPSLAAGAGVTKTVTIAGAALGDFARASFSLDLQGIMLAAWISAANTVSVRFQNGTAGAIDLTSGTLRVRVERASI